MNRTDMDNNNEALSWVPVITPRRVENARRTLCLNETATFDDIRAAYRALAHTWHPDRASPENKAEYNRVFSKISAAYAYLKVLVRHYRYDLSEEAIKHDQEPADIRHLRRFGGGFYAGEEEINLRDDPSRGALRLTAENVTLARKKLCLLPLSTREQITQNYRRLVQRQSANTEADDGDNQEMTVLHRCHALLQYLVAVYRYSFRPEDIAAKQQDHLESHRKRHGNDPVWAGGTYDDTERDLWPDLDFEKPE